MPRILTAVMPSVLQGRDQGGNIAEVFVVSAVLFREESVDGVMEVIAPLTIKTIPSVAGIAQQARIVEIAFRNYMKLAPYVFGEFCDGALQLRQKMDGAEVKDSVNGIEAQGVEVVLFEPVQCVFAKKAPHFVAAFPIVIDCLAPRCSVTVRKIRPKST